MTALSKVALATDGACKGNPGPGGWGAVIRSGTAEKELSGGEPLPDAVAHIDAARYAPMRFAR